MPTNIVKRQPFSASRHCVTLRPCLCFDDTKSVAAWTGRGSTSLGRPVESLHGLRFPLALFLACFLAFLIGCGKQKTSSPQETPSPRGAEAVSADVDQVSTVLTELTQLVRKYSVEQRKAPKSLDELVAKGYLDSVPQAPNGKRFAINKNLQVYLAEP